ncbi:NAD-dependent dihydropyrimidine dehydrogenase PreA subunit [Roseateles terrae]|uniref:NAD-dependent dihydropyrimidine dehydrogenase PreA subunit n=1 Tax=Roseateles terrae TaxID=431060 RepID=A0ABR6GMQ4_9BURK|nr:ferredoxin family protein [Roseateles terrae]MBB3193384.1 NAD-dependent dihydropyrimidine dehydrogenase PreA subunit [Roseateles terrae]
MPSGSSGETDRSQRPSGVSALLAGDSCRQPPGRLVPAIDRNRCEGKADCLAVCPYGVFEIGVLPRDERSALSLIGKLKGLAHGWQQAFTPNADACRACGHCVSACPERAITLVRREPRAAGQPWSPPI